MLDDQDVAVSFRRQRSVIDAAINDVDEQNPAQALSDILRLLSS